jgi:hypothetical protein
MQQFFHLKEVEFLSFKYFVDKFPYEGRLHHTLLGGYSNFHSEYILAHFTHKRMQR